MKNYVVRGLAGLLLSASAASASAQSVAPADRWTIIHAGSLIEEVGQPIKSNQSIIVKNDRVDSIKGGFVGAEALPNANSASVTVIELRDKVVMAGMMDAHVHLGGRTGQAGAITEAQAKLMGGATTVRDASSDPTVIFPLREAIDKGLVLGPRILPSGSALSTTGGHGDSRNGDFAASLHDLPDYVAVCDGVDACTKATRTQILLGATQIKIMATAGVSDNSDTGLDQQFTTEELNTIVNVSHLMKRKVMAHAIGRDGIKVAVRAGVDSIEHADYLDDEGAQLMKQRGTYLVPTLNAPSDVLRRIRNPRPGDRVVSENTKSKMLGLPAAQPGGLGGQVRVAVKNGVKIGAGTDFGGIIGDELVLLVENGGMTPEAALKAATIGNADLFGMSDKLGTITAGKYADIIALNGDPTKDIKQTLNPPFVMVAGRVAKDPNKTTP